MTLQSSEAIANAALDQYEDIVGASPFLHLYTGAPPLDCSAAATGTLIVAIPLPADWMAPAALGQKDAAGLWAEKSAAAGVAGYFRIYNNAQTVCHHQGTVGLVGSGSDMEMDDNNIPTNKWVIIDSYSLIASNL